MMEPEPGGPLVGVSLFQPQASVLHSESLPLLFEQTQETKNLIYK